VSKPVKILLVEDSEDDAKLTLRALRQGEFDPTYRRVQTAADFESALAQEHWDAVISDFRMPGFTGTDALGIFRNTGLDIPFILVSGTIGEETAVNAMNAGASDYIMKKSLARLAPALERELKETQMRAEHRQAQHDLAESEERFRQMADNIRDVFFLIDGETKRMLYISPAYEEIWGRTCESAYADPNSWTRAIHADDRAAAAESYKTGMQAGKFEYEYRIARPDGEIRWLEVRGFPVRDDDGKVVRVTGVARDITNREKVAQNLRESERRFSDLMQTVELISLMLDREARITYCNDYLLRLTGWTREELIGGDWYSIFMPGQADDMKSIFAASLANLPAAWNREGEIVTRSGERRLIRWNNSVLRSGAGEVIGSASIGEDITEQTRAETKVKHLNRVYAVLSGINTLIVRVRDRDELFREACRIAVEEGGFRLSWIGVVDRSAMEIVPVSSAGADDGFLDLVRGRLSLLDDAPMGHGVTALAARQRRPVVVNDTSTDPRVRHKNAHADRGMRSLVSLPLLVADETVATFDLHAAETGYFDEAEMKLLIELAANLSYALDHIEKGKKLDYLAYYDPITGLANQTLFLERLQAKLVSARGDSRKKVVFALDVERFKSINDAFGRKEGDELLKQIGERLVHFGGGDANRFARIEADRFAIVAAQLQNVEEVGRYVEQRLAATFHGPFRIGDSDVRVSVKVGIALFPDDGEDAETLFKNAEAALKKAKNTGERYLFFTPAMTARVAERLSLENKLQRALDNGEFVLHYQPVVNLLSGKVVSAEALIRWNDPHSGLVPPGQFIPILEETGLIQEVGRWALHKAIACHLGWRTAGFAPVRIAVNVSPMQLRNRGFIDEITQAIAVDARSAEGLELEITEGMIMADVEQSIATLQAIRNLGVTIAIDDFGTGFSSLGYLARLPIDTLKVDRSFVTDMTTSQPGLALVSTIINLAHSLKLKVVAEGVETDEQSRLLHLLNCDEMQGFLFSKAVPCEEFEAKFLSRVGVDEEESERKRLVLVPH
jgi:diguanylate cyclase (GGDEF)-like protein/PAS domain S-box-containing protein